MRLDIAVLQPGHERRIETGKTVAVVEIVEAQPMSERGPSAGAFIVEISSWREG